MKAATLALAAWMAGVSGAAAQPTQGRALASTLAAAALGRVCIVNLNDPHGLGQTLAIGGEFGFTDLPPDIAARFLQGAPGVVRELRTRDKGALVVMQRLGTCTVFSEWADPAELPRALEQMASRGGLAELGRLSLLERGAAGSDLLWRYRFVPSPRFAEELAARGGNGQSFVISVAVSRPGARPFEGTLTLSPEP